VSDDSREEFGDPSDLEDLNEAEVCWSISCHVYMSEFFDRTTMVRTIPAKMPTSRARTRRVVLSPTSLARQETRQSPRASARLVLPNDQMRRGKRGGVRLILLILHSTKLIFPELGGARMVIRASNSPSHKRSDRFMAVIMLSLIFCICASALG
jgi:hypothetical protein